MNPRNNIEQSGLTLPAPAEEHAVLPPASEVNLANPEQQKQALAPSMAVPAAAAAVPAVPVTPLTVAGATLAPSAPPSGSTTLVTTPPVADDTDLIEKEWVLKAKQIVNQTREDPYTQTKEMSRFKADYLKKRYNKEIKKNDE